MPRSDSSQAFQVNLDGIIDLLSNHLYSGPQVFVRELLQNAVDAIRAREAHARTDSAEGAQDFGRIRLELIPAPAGTDGAAATLVVEDDGIGLDAEEVHAFLSTIGQSSKRDRDLSSVRENFIGQFGIGLLSCFIVSDEIVLITRSARGAPALEWRGRNDGTYTLKQLDGDLAPGTKVYLRCRQGREEYFEPERLVELARHYGGLLPYSIRFVHGEREEMVNAELPPWLRNDLASGEEAHEAYLEFGARMLGEQRFFDVVPLHVPIAGLKGAAYVLPFASAAGRRSTHRVYLKQMFLAEEAANLLPDWAFFVSCVVDAQHLRPTASREGFYEDAALDETREALGKTLRNYLIRLAEHDPERLRAFIALHHHSIGALVLADDEAYRIFADWMPVETSLGRMSLGEYRAQFETMRYVASHDQFRQLSPVAAAQQEAIIDAGYVYIQEILERLDELDPGASVEEVDATSITQRFDEVDSAAQHTCERLLACAQEELAQYGCDVAVKRFKPTSMPVLYTVDAQGMFWRSLEQTREQSDGLWAGLLGDLAGAHDDIGGAPDHAAADEAHRSSWRRDAVLCFNHANELVQQLAAQTDAAALRLAVRVLYVQALLLSHYPLRPSEMQLLNDALTEMLHRAAT